VEVNVHEHIARTVYYFSVHLLFASAVACAAGVLTSIRKASATTKYWVWVMTVFNFVVPLSAAIDKLWTRHLARAAPLGIIGGPVWDMTQRRTAVVLALMWMTGAFCMLVRLIWRIRKEHREDQALAGLRAHDVTSSFVAHGIPVSFGAKLPGPSVRGVFNPQISFPSGIERLLNKRELNAVLLHELAHARRRDNFVGLLYELSLCALWFNPLIWLAGVRMSLYRELSCDESVIRREHGQALVSALAKLAVPEQAPFLQATASSHLAYRLARLTGPSETGNRAASLLLMSLFVAVVLAGILETIAHTACCFILKH
jgi:beta-lactamase regulating signal transducer with metallopeptidase domain